jgi:hypothetical protein
VQDLSFNRLKIGKFSPFQRTLAISQGIDSLVGQWEACKIAAEPTAHTSKTAMNVLRRRINPKTFVITNRQLAKYLKIDTTRIWRWEKWAHVLWVHIEGVGGYFISYRKLEQTTYKIMSAQRRRSPFLEKMRSPSETTLLITTIEAVEVSRV